MDRVTGHVRSGGGRSFGSTGGLGAPDGQLGDSSIVRCPGGQVGWPGRVDDLEAEGGSHGGGFSASASNGDPPPTPRPYGHEVVGLRCPGYFSITMIAASFTNARKLAAFFSYRVATRRYCLTFDQNRSARFRSLYKCGSTSRCSARVFWVGITASAPRASISSTRAFLS